MASILKGGRLTLALIILIVISSSSHIITTTATARTPYKHVRQLATKCVDDYVQQIDGPDGCGSGSRTGSGNGNGNGSGSGSGSGGSLIPQPCGSTPGGSLCRKGCCGINKMQRAICCL